MSLRPVARPLPASLALLLLLPLAPVAGCSRDDRQKLGTVQDLARDLHSATLLKQRAGCHYLVAAQRELLLCDGMLQTLLHYAPGFPGSTVTAVGASTGGLFSRTTHLMVHYENRDSRGNLEVVLRREGNDWRIAALAPRP